MQRSIFFAAALALCYGPASYADDPQVADLGQIGVTATRTPESAVPGLTPVTVITRSDIQAMQATTLLDVFQGVPGLQLANDGGLGKSVSVFLRGTSSDQVLILVNGVRINDPTLGTAEIQDIPVDQIERIEVASGPYSSLYGSEAVGGVIQIFTQHPSTGIAPYATLSGGSYATYKLAAGASGGGERAWYDVGASDLHSTGFNACDGRPPPAADGCFTFEPDDDGYRNRSYSLSGGYQPVEPLGVSADLLHSEGDTQFDGSFVNGTHFVEQTASAKAVYSPSAAWRLSSSLGSSRNDQASYSNAAFVDYFNTRGTTASLQSDLSLLPAQVVTLGLDRQVDRVASDVPFPVTRRTDQGAFTEYQGQFGSQQIKLSGRHDHDGQFGAANTGAFGWGDALTTRLKLMASFGSAFKAPNLDDLYYPGFGNPRLQPETSRSAETGLDYAAAGGRWGLHIYQTDIRDLILFDSTSAAPANIGLARIRGAEATLVTELLGWGVTAAASLLNPVNRTAGAEDGRILPLRSRRLLNLDLQRAFGAVTLGMTLHAAGPRYGDVANTKPLGGYGTLDLRFDYGLSAAWKLQLKLGNLLDKDYQTENFYNQPGSTVFVTLRYAPTANE